MRLHGRYHSPLSRALSQFTGALGQVGDHGGDGLGGDDHGDYDHGDDDHGNEDDDDDDWARLF